MPFPHLLPTAAERHLMPAENGSEVEINRIFDCISTPLRKPEQTVCL
ncbi:Uncharacterized protein dnm_070080 [Desulfonema magnum]|uniref:Uncharacterized protein n=1 Tax=Desulfonema magnum TaxID=45655 RepID=A0A975GRF7_9BACT|nr:Uncharacterized protein dnm_070080 [Desulfonema magnum]